MHKNNLKKGLSFAYNIILQIVGIQTCLTVNNLASLSVYNVKGYTLVFLASLFFIYSVFTKKKMIYYLSTIFVFSGYIYTFYTVFRLKDSTVALKPGFYFYIFTLIYFVIILLIKEEKEKNQKEEEKDKLKQSIVQETKNDDLENNYIIGTYLYGVKGKPDFSNHICAVTTDGNSNDLIIILTSNETFNYKIKYNQIEKITVKKGMSINHNNNQKVEDYSLANSLLATALVGVWGSFLTQQFENSSMSNKIDYSVAFTVEIIHKVENESKKVVIEFSQNPDYFFNKYAELYQKIS